MVSLGSSLGGGSNGGFGDSCKAAVGAAAATYAAPVSTATTASEGAYAAPAAVTTAASPATVAAPAYTAPATTTIAAPAVAYATPAASIIAGAPATSAAGVASTTYQISTESVGSTDGGLSGSSAGGFVGSAGHYLHCSSSCYLCNVSGIRNRSSACVQCSHNVHSAGHQHHCCSSCQNRSGTCNLCSGRRVGDLWDIHQKCGRHGRRLDFWLRGRCRR